MKSLALALIVVDGFCRPVIDGYYTYGKKNLLDLVARGRMLLLCFVEHMQRNFAHLGFAGFDMNTQ